MLDYWIRQDCAVRIVLIAIPALAAEAAVAVHSAANLVELLQQHHLLEAAHLDEVANVLEAREATISVPPTWRI